MVRVGKLKFTVLAIVGAALATPSLQAQHYTRTDLTENASGVSSTATHIDPNLVNAWGLSRGSGSPWWVSDNGTGLSTLYDGAGTPQALVVTVASPQGVSGPSTPTGTAFNFTTRFEVVPTKPAVFMFVTEQGTVAAWNPGANPTVALVKVNNSGHAVYKGMALAQTTSGPLLYATNFKTARIDVFDGDFNPVHLGGRAFTLDGDDDDRDDHKHGDDERHPELVWAPFNIQNVGGNLVVTYAKKAPGATDETPGAGFGRIVVYDNMGRRIKELERGPWLNAPWGVTLAPADFGAFSHRLLIGNFGDGTIHAYNAVSGRFEGTLLGSDGKALTIDGLWALSFGGGTTRNGSSTELYFTAGPDDESNGLLGKIVAVATEQRGNSE